MFPLTHIATAKAVLGKENTMTVLGSIFPDLVSYLGVGRNVGHELGNDLYKYCLAYFPECTDFALGVLTHGTSLPGIDTYADEIYHNQRPGFCFREGKKIAPYVEKYCNVPPNMALWKSHNFIEIAFDIITAHNQRDLQNRAERHIYQEPVPVTDLLQAYLKAPADKIEAMFREVPQQFCFDGTDIEQMTEKFLQSLKNRHGITGGNLAKATEITERALEIIDPKYDSFMGEVLPEIKENLAMLPTTLEAEPPSGGFLHNPSLTRPD